MKYIIPKEDLSNLTDIELVSLSLTDNEEAFNFLIKRYLKLVYGVVSRYIFNSDEKDDITQEVFIKIWKNLNKYDSKRKFSTWIWEIAKNSALDHLKKKQAITFSGYENQFGQKIENLLIDHNNSLLQKIEKLEVAKKLITALSLLDFNSQEAISLHHQQELSFKEISKIKNRPLNTIKSQYRRGLQKLKKLL